MTHFFDMSIFVGWGTLFIHCIYTACIIACSKLCVLTLSPQWQAASARHLWDPPRDISLESESDRIDRHHGTVMSRSSRHYVLGRILMFLWFMALSLYCTHTSDSGYYTVSGCYSGSWLWPWAYHTQVLQVYCNIQYLNVALGVDYDPVSVLYIYSRYSVLYSNQFLLWELTITLCLYCTYTSGILAIS